VLQNAYQPRTGIFATVLGLLTLAFGASTFVVEVRDVLNAVWKAPVPASGVGLRSVILLAKERFHALAIVLGAGFLLLVSLVLNASLTATAKLLTSSLSIPASLLHVINFVFSFLVIAGLFALIYRVLPEVSLTWSDVAVGALITSLLFTIGKQLIGLYLGTAGIGSAYGAAGSLVVVLLWVYYSAQLFLFGAEFTKVYARTLGSHLSPTQSK
jgi:membrane protein